MTKVCNVWPCDGARQFGIADSPAFVVGVECEIEAVKGHGSASLLGWEPKQDNSLRNNGMEYVSKPMERAMFMDKFVGLHKTLQLGKDPFSQRTSNHVHVNVASLDMVQARNMVLLYALFEECFFMMVKPERRNNIHCVPLTETSLPAIYKKGLDEYVKRWSKYTALNLKRIPDLGTMEFRHMHGTKDANEMNTWLCVLEKLWKLAQEVEVNEQTLTDKNIVSWFETIFKDTSVIQLRPSLFEVIRNNLIDVKFSI
jgi:hypothetical protein